MARKTSRNGLHPPPSASADSCKLTWQYTERHLVHRLHVFPGLWVVWWIFGNYSPPLPEKIGPIWLSSYQLPVNSPSAPGELRGRFNARGVDLNRNWGCRWTANPTWHNQIVTGAGGAETFSEPETTTLRDFILARNPVAVVLGEACASERQHQLARRSGHPRHLRATAQLYGRGLERQSCRHPRLARQFPLTGVFASAGIHPRPQQIPRRSVQGNQK